ncbi:MAG: PQQ-dependent sugar dehydrogenase [Gemmataceae bacterium]|nr:PQQ-dependent sugar dehydrogenase [Gemmataceae bacterium]
MSRSTLLTVLFTTSLLVLGGWSLTAGGDGKKPLRKQSGLEKRVPWTTSKMVGFPEPPPPYTTEPAFPKLPKFEEPLDMTYAPGTNRLFIAERWGKIYSFVNIKNVDKANLALEFKGAKDSKGQPMRQVIYAIAFHPKFKDNGYMYVTWVPNPEKEGLPRGTRVSRFTVKGAPPVADPNSEKFIMEWPNGGHNGGGLKFGPDGFLYIVTGDGSGIADERVIGQDLSSILAKMLRIDVDNPPPGKAYAIPKDNPFVNTKDARPEIWAYGLRQLWRFSFDRKTGQCWGGEVGQDLWEMVYKIEKGGNYGWSVMEGNHTFRPERKKGPTPILKPVIEHSHSDFRSITGGFVYHGKHLPELQGHYIYGDFDTGRIWRVRRYEHKFEVWDYLNFELARTTYRIITWAEDAEGELYFVDFTGGRIHQLVKAPQAKAQAPFPKKLSETGVFASTKDHKVAPGLIPYTVNSQLWGDHAVKDRYLGIPGEGQIGFDEITYPQPSPGSTPGWRFPDGTVLVKTFSMEMERGNPLSRKRLETRLLHFQQFPGTQEYGDQYWRGYTYVWNDEQTDAFLLDEKGADRLLKIKVGGQVVEQNYRFPSRAECTLCHTNAAKFALGASTMQMNRDHDYGGVIANQLATLEHIGLFSKPLPMPPGQLPKLPDFHDNSLPVEQRARSYLHSNCAHCHIKWGGGNAEFKLMATLPLKEMGIVNVPPAHGNFGVKDAKLLVPGYPEKSIVLHRMAMTGLGRMPHISSRVVDDLAVRLVRDWIKEMPKE